MTPRPLILALVLALPAALSAATLAPATAVIPANTGIFAPPALDELPAQRASRMVPLVERYRADRDALEHVRALADRGGDPLYAPRREAMRTALIDDWLRLLEGVDAAALDQDDRLDRLLLLRHLRVQREARSFEKARYEAIRPLLPGYEPLVALLEDRRELRQADPRTSAAVLEQARADLDARGKRLAGKDEVRVAPALAQRAARHAVALRAAMKDWHTYQSGYDPQFSWWVDAPWAALDTQLETHITLLRDTLGGGATPESLNADPIGDEAIRAALVEEGIDYTPAELMAAAERELAWCRAEMERAAAEIGVRDWRHALEQVKDRYVAPGEQPALVVELADEAVRFLRDRDLLSVPPASTRGWRMTMLSPEWQLQAPFFLGGQDVWVAFPTDAMPWERKLNALRGNNRHFSRAVVQHELVPGHHLQHWYAERYARHRADFESPFWLEGWALYWELRLYDLGFAATPEDRLGMLFWRSHRAARILFSLGLQSGRMTPEEAVTLLVERVGHEPENARAEVRRTISGDFGPLYQVAYLVGGWQFRALRQERVVEGGWSEREFHDRVLREGSMPIGLLRERLFERVEVAAPRTPWRFLDSPANASAR